MRNLKKYFLTETVIKKNSPFSFHYHLENIFENIAKMYDFFISMNKII